MLEPLGAQPLSSLLTVGDMRITLSAHSPMQGLLLSVTSRHDHTYA
jgi:hypothetical protein